MLMMEEASRRQVLAMAVGPLFVMLMKMLMIVGDANDHPWLHEFDDDDGGSLQKTCLSNGRSDLIWQYDHDGDRNNDAIIDGGAEDWLYYQM